MPTLDLEGFGVEAGVLVLIHLLAKILSLIPNHSRDLWNQITQDSKGYFRQRISFHAPPGAPYINFTAEMCLVIESVINVYHCELSFVLGIFQKMSTCGRKRRISMLLSEKRPLIWSTQLSDRWLKTSVVTLLNLNVFAAEDNRCYHCSKIWLLPFKEEVTDRKRLSIHPDS